MSPSTHGSPASGTEVTHVSSHGVWLITDGRELFLSYDDFPWFKDAPIGKIINIEQASPGHLCWPELDIDLAIDSIENPDNFPLQAK